MTNSLERIIDREHLLLLSGDDDTTTALAAEYAAQARHGIGYLTYPGSGVSDVDDDVFEISQEHLKEANRYLMRANKNMHRSLPRQNVAQDNALRRDMWLVRWCHSVYIIGLFTQDASLLKINTDVAWPAQMYVDRFLYDQEPMELCDLYLFDMKSEAWWSWRGQWTMIKTAPKASGMYTVLSNEKLSNAGKTAVRALYRS